MLVYQRLCGSKPIYNLVLHRGVHRHGGTPAGLWCNIYSETDGLVPPIRGTLHTDLLHSHHFTTRLSQFDALSSEPKNASQCEFWLSPSFGVPQTGNILEFTDLADSPWQTDEVLHCSLPIEVLKHMGVGQDTDTPGTKNVCSWMVVQRNMVIIGFDPSPHFPCISTEDGPPQLQVNWILKINEL